MAEEMELALEYGTHDTDSVDCEHVFSESRSLKHECLGAALICEISVPLLTFCKCYLSEGSGQKKGTW